MTNKITKYKSGSGNEVVIEKLENKRIIKLYRFFMEYVRRIKKIIGTSENAKKDPNYIKFCEDMVAIKDALRQEIKDRALKMSSID